MHLGESVATARVVEQLSKSFEVMTLVNGLMKAPEISATMQEFTKEMTKVGVMKEFVSESLHLALDTDDIEDKIEEEVDARELLCAELDLYEHALQDLCTFARKKSFYKHMDDDQFNSRLEVKIESPNFLETLGSIYMAFAKVSQESQDDHSSWDFINEKDWTSSET
ncbi:hypothetical protein L7F22_031708 [Adiantum nelumboides]|nr:hypothetical protein [Adiantum nelumboides]